MASLAVKTEYLDLLERKANAVKYRGQIRTLYPPAGPCRWELYPKHLRFFKLGATCRQRVAQGGNRIGKTLGIGGYEVACHLTGIYPEFWEGKRFARPNKWWAAGITYATTKAIVQAKLFGNIAELGMVALGTGLIPKDCIEHVKVTDGFVESARIKFAGGGTSVISFKSYDMGWEKFQGEELDGVWLDEEPDARIYSECQLRTVTTHGLIILTYTPKKGRTAVVMMFRDCSDDGSSVMALVKIRWADVPHLTDEDKAEALKGAPEFLHEAIINGEATSAIGRVYAMNASEVVCAPFRRPPHWRYCFGFDGGYKNTAALWLGIDDDTDTAYVWSEYKPQFEVGKVSIPIHASAIKARGVWIPGVGDAAAISQVDGAKLLDLYRDEGVRMILPDKAVKSGISTVRTRFETGRLKIFSTCQKLIEEFTEYQYEEDPDEKDAEKVVKRNDHLMDALRYAVVSGIPIAKSMRPEGFARVPEMTFGLYN